MTGSGKPDGLSPREWERISGWLDELLDLPGHEQEHRLAQLARENEGLSKELRQLLAADRDSSDLLAAPASEALGGLFEELGAGTDSETERAGGSPPEEVGAYRLVRELGRGGMGVVYLAERSDGEFEQRVALKLVKRGLDTDAILARFRRERQILARLQHPSIARLLDGGAAADGRPYFAMEFVDGRPITEACDRVRATLEERLRRFQSVCEAVQYAHGQLVVHRDLKPANILVSDDGDLKLLDFGIAQLLDEEEGQSTRMTEPGVRPLTPAYAAPEQLEGEPATVATDVYALGVVLCELLCGLRPTRGQEPGERFATAPSVLALASPPDQPSAERRAHLRKSDPAGLRRRLSGDLDAIVAKALRPDPERRYLSAEALRRDIGRHLEGLPVEAAPESALYLARKFLSRHRAGVAASLALVVALTAGLAGTAWQARQRALEARKAEEVSDFVLGLFEAADPALAQGEQITALELLEQGARRVETELEGQPEVQAEMEQVLGDVYWKLGQAETGLALIERGLERGDATERTALRAQALRSKGGILVDLGRREEARPLLFEALAMHEETLGPDHPEVAEDLDRLVVLTQAEGELDTARELAERSLAIRRAALGEDHVETADSHNNLGVLSRQAGDYEAAEWNYAKALAIRRAKLGDRHPETMDSLGNFATLLYFRGRYEEARDRFAELVETHDQVYGRRHPATVRARNNLAAQLVQLARLDEAETIYREVLEFWAETTGTEHPNALGTRSNLAMIERLRGRLQSAEELDRAVLEAAVPALGAEHPLTARFRGRLASSLREAGKLDEALELATGALEIDERTFGPDAPQVAGDLFLIGQVQRDRGALGEARARLERALEIRVEVLGERSLFVGETRSALGEVLLSSGDARAAAAELRAGLEIARATLPEGHPAIGRASWALGRALTAEGALTEAEALLNEALVISSAAHGAESWRAAAVQVDLGICRSRGGEPDSGARLAAEGLARLRSELGPEHPLPKEVEGRLRGEPSLASR